MTAASSARTGVSLDQNAVFSRVDRGAEPANLPTVIHSRPPWCYELYLTHICI